MHRSNLNTLSSSQLTELADLIRTHVTPSVLDDHHAWHNVHGSGGTQGPGSGERFLAFHRNFIGNLEDSLTNQGKVEFVPLQKWDPMDPIPAEFSHSGRNTNNPRIQLPTWATESGGTTGDPIFGYTSLRQFQSSDELGRSLGSNYHGSVHNTVGGDMSTMSSPRDPIFYPWHAFLDDIWSEWEALVQSSPDSSTTPSPSPGNTDSNSNSICFIATAAYGSDLEPPVQFLREFRDEVVLKGRCKKAFESILNVYYKFSPPVADYMRKNNSFKIIMKYSIVLPFVALARITAFILSPFTKKRWR